jgi:hypothetical protein
VLLPARVLGPWVARRVLGGASAQPRNRMCAAPPGVWGRLGAAEELDVRKDVRRPCCEGGNAPPATVSPGNYCP